MKPTWEPLNLACHVRRTTMDDDPQPTFDDFVASVRELLATLEQASADSPEGRLRKGLQITLRDYDATG